jgi:hypothetical protein
MIGVVSLRTFFFQIPEIRHLALPVFLLARRAMIPARVGKLMVGQLTALPAFGSIERENLLPWTTRNVVREEIRFIS